MVSKNKLATLQEIPPIADRIDHLLDTVGDGSGQTEQAAAADEYVYKPGIGVVAILVRLLFGMETSGMIVPDRYGDQVALANGIKICVKDKSEAVIHDFTPNPIKATWHWGLLAGVDVRPAFQAGTDRAIIRWTFSKAGYPTIVNGDKGEYFSVNVRDSLAALTSHLMQLQGYKAIG